ncbi:hypothetical protein BGZ65_006131 [Modicella reniformis]|uniref:Uncharacterized protein n=1 Tax=Modicella reniformis TaxID=1440133 RepID=A0A9P6IZS3_9FUNG|nr:hypothetical protein BGZ65_006131 [Modicella reniformis]
MATIDEKVAAAMAHKDQGNEAFKEGDLTKVLGLSGLDNQMSGMPMMAQMRPQESGTTEAQKNEIRTQLAVVYANMAACHLKKNNFKRAIEVCNSALKQDPNNTKAKFRRGQARLGDGNLAGAEADFQSLGTNVPGVKAELERIKKKSKEAEERQRKSMGGFLSRGRIMTEEDQKEEEIAAATTSTEEAASPAKTPKSKPTLASRSANNQSRKPKPVTKEEEYTPTTWSGTAPKIQELEEGEE